MDEPEDRRANTVLKSKFNSWRSMVCLCGCKYTKHLHYFSAPKCPCARTSTRRNVYPAITQKINVYHGRRKKFSECKVASVIIKFLSRKPNKLLRSLLAPNALISHHALPCFPVAITLRSLIF